MVGIWCERERGERRVFGVVVVQCSELRGERGERARGARDETRRRGQPPEDASRNENPSEGRKL